MNDNKIGIFVDIDKKDKSIHCFSGESEYPTFELQENKLVAINQNKTNPRAHVIIGSRHVTIPKKQQQELFYMGIKEIVLFTTDMQYLCYIDTLRMSQNAKCDTF